MPTAAKTAAAKPTPPTSAIAKDAHWAATQERLRNRTRATATLTICDNLEARKALDVARYALRRIEGEAADRPDDQAVKDAVAAAKADVDTAQAAFDETSIVLTFRALPRLEFEALKKAHPATEEQAEDGHDLNVETLGPELIAAASVDGMPVEAAREYLDTWSEAEAAELFNVAWGVQQTTRMDLGKG
ncbi:hypothetical protein [Streptomyces sp. sk2.1]|uniref:hypothetical protein n=1 Tax=Streptomyces sp. sk2.1 TaxID=2478959 RepID=UPI0011E7E2DB|nr:hypothetical protein [Streptomyces sp. sk2.1]TXS68935.1 hypothetical protein EAO76_26580 [Streptomyces sp. sk2.1]